MTNPNQTNPDQNIPDVTDDDRRLAREWAGFINSNMTLANLEMRAAARVILNAVPTPPRPTLADMTPDERATCRWMQCDYAGEVSTPVVIVTPFDEHAETGLVSADGGIVWAPSDSVTPRPDLPRMEWPGDQEPAPAPALPGDWRLADHRDHGRVMVTTQTTGSDGNVFFVLPSDGPLGYDGFFCTPDELTYLDQEGDTPTGPGHLAVGTVIESADDPRIDDLPEGSVLLDCDRESVAKRHGEWVGLGYIPIESERDEFGPWTVRRIGWEADQ